MWNLQSQILTAGALHRADSSALRFAAADWHAELAPLPKPLVIVNIGGPTSKYSPPSCPSCADYIPMYPSEVLDWGTEQSAVPISGTTNLQTLNSFVLEHMIILQLNCSSILNPHFMYTVIFNDI